MIASDNHMEWMPKGPWFPYYVTRTDDALPARWTRPSRHARYGFTLDKHGQGLVHVVHRVAICWDRPRPFLVAGWRCGGDSIKVALRRVADLDDLCTGCRIYQRVTDMGLDARAPVVYYAERDGLIKIGWSRNVAQRMVNLKANLLAVEPATQPGLEQERLRHRQFTHLKATGEWFEAGSDLIDHIDAIKAAS